MVEYLAKVAGEDDLDLKEYFNQERLGGGPKLFYHSHCQQKTTGTAQPTEKLLGDLGFDIQTSTVECCGMAGSFGYKTDFFDISQRVGEDLFAQIQRSQGSGDNLTLLASGTSCLEQIESGTGREVLHPMELLARILT